MLPPHLAELWSLSSAAGPYGWPTEPLSRAAVQPLCRSGLVPEPPSEQQDLCQKSESSLFLAVFLPGLDFCPWLQLIVSQDHPSLPGSLISMHVGRPLGQGGFAWKRETKPEPFLASVASCPGGQCYWSGSTPTESLHDPTLGLPATCHGHQIKETFSLRALCRSVPQLRISQMIQCTEQTNAGYTFAELGPGRKLGGH